MKGWCKCLYKRLFKRLLGLLFGVIALPFLVVLILVVGPMIYWEDKGPVFYLAPRRGMNGRIFRMLKFRSMKVNVKDIRNKNNSTFNSSNDPRVTRIGRFIRATSIDELPQIINVIKGDMSWIGPRASIPRNGISYADLNDMQRKRLTVRPGITGYTAALYRNSITPGEKLKHDCYYAENVSFSLDFKIVIWTIRTVFTRKNVFRNQNEGKS